MSAARWLVLATVVILGASVGCADEGGSRTAAGGTVGGSTTIGADGNGGEAEVERAFRGYNDDLVRRDFDAACARHAPETTEKLLENVRSEGLDASGCVAALASIYSLPGAREALDGIIDTMEVDGITIDGDTATVAWSAEFEGRRVRPEPAALRLIDGSWKVVDVD